MQQRPNGIPESWNIDATKNNFVLNTYNIKDNNKIENDLKNEELKKMFHLNPNMCQNRGIYIHQQIYHK